MRKERSRQPQEPQSRRPSQPEPASKRQAVHGTAPGPSSASQAASPAAESASELRERMRRVGSAPKRPRGYKRLVPASAPQWMQQFDRELARLKKHPLIERARRELRAELKAAELTPPLELLEMAARSKALLDMVDGGLFSLIGGPMNRHARRLHTVTVERKDLVGQYLALRVRLGLDPAPEIELQAPSFAASFARGMREAMAKDSPRSAPPAPDPPPAARQLLLPLLAPEAHEPPAPEPTPARPPPTPPVVEDLGNIRTSAPRPHQPETITSMADALEEMYMACGEYRSIRR